MTYKSLLLVSAVVLSVAALPACNETGTGNSGATSDSAASTVRKTPSNTVMTARMKEKLAGRYDDVADYSEGFIAVSLDGKYTFVDSSGKELLPPQFENMSSFQNGYASVTRNGSQGIIDKTGKDVFPFHADWAYLGSVQDGILSARNKAERYGFVDLKGETIIPFVYDNVSVSWFQKGAAIVSKNGKYGMINLQNGVLLPFDYASINDFEENNDVTTAQKGSNWFLVRRDGSVAGAVPGSYVEIGPFSYGLAQVKKGELFGFIDTGGRAVIAPTLTSAGYFNKWGVAKVHNGTEAWLIDKTGKPLLKKGYWDIDQVAQDHFIVYAPGEGERLGMINSAGKELWPIEYLSIVPMGEEEFMVTHVNRGRYFANLKGEKIAGLVD